MMLSHFLGGNDENLVINHQLSWAKFLTQKCQANPDSAQWMVGKENDSSMQHHQLSNFHRHPFTISNYP